MKRLLLVLSARCGWTRARLASQRAAHDAARFESRRRTPTSGSRTTNHAASRTTTAIAKGIKEGEKDARSRDVFNYQDERTWQRADKGYHRSYGDSQRYQQSFRTGYAAGYSDGYRRYAPTTATGYQRRRVSRTRAAATAIRRVGYPQGGYPQGGYGYPGPGRLRLPPVTTATARRTRTA